ncbi:MAG: TadG family pilus assembly protein [Rhizobiaceae bacterium]
MGSLATSRPAERLRAVCRFVHDRSGNIALVGSISMLAIIPLAAIGIDAGSLYLERRTLQGVADLAAITAAANIDKAEKATRLFLRDNGITDFTVTLIEPGERPGGGGPFDVSKNGVQVMIETGRYTADAALDPADRFDRETSMVDAVKVTVRKPGTLYFGSGLVRPPALQASGTAQIASEAAFSVGSRLLRVEGGVLNALLNGLLGTSIALDVMDYEALLDADVELLGFLDALASEIHVTAGTYEELLDSDIAVGQLARAMARVARGNPVAVRALLAVAADRQAADIAMRLDRLVDLGSLAQLAIGSGSAAFGSKVNVLEMLTAAAAIANGENQVRLDLGLAVPGVAGLTAELAIGEPPQFAPWFAVGRTGTVVRTAQTRLFLEARVGGAGALAGVSVTLPLYLELAYAEARLDRITCTGRQGRRAKVVVDARPGVADLWIADVDRASMKRFDRRPDIDSATLVKAPLISVKGLAHVEIGNPDFAGVTFSQRDIARGEIKTVSTHDVIGSLIKSLLGDLSLEVRAAGLGLTTPALVQSALVSVLEPVAAPLDNVVYNLLAALGVKVGQADIRVHGVKCGSAVLVQ